jgi:parallel beta-helix repeat protein
MAGPALPTNRGTSNTPAEHVNDHNTAHAYVNDMGNRVAYVKDYFATGDGTTDDTSFIENARLALVAAGSGEMIFERGKTYSVSKITISSKIDYNLNGATIKSNSGTPEGVFQAEGWGGATVIADATIRNGTIDCNTTAKRGIFLYLANRCRVLYNRIFNCATTTDSGIRLHLSTTDCTVRGNHITMATDSPFGTVAAAAGIYCVSTTPDSQGGGQNNTLTFGSASALSQGHIIEGNHVYNGTHGISLFGAANCRVIGNYLNGQTHRSVIISPIAHRNVIANNTCIDFGSTGIHMAWGCLSNVITGNVCVTSVGRDELNGIKGYFGCSDNTVIGNYVEGVGAGAVRFAMGSVGNLVANNRIKSCAVGVQFESYLPGAYYQPTTPPGNDNNAAIGNLITGTPIGISIEASGAAGLAGTTIRSNDIVSPATAGVQITEANSQLASTVTAVGNKISGTPTWTLPRLEAHFALKAANSGLVDTRPDLGIVRTVVPPGPTSAVTIGSANSTRFYRVTEGGTISKVRANIVTSSGNIAVAVYANSGAGLTSTPGTRLATSGSVASPGTGVQDVSLGATVTVAIGDWLAIGADNATVTFLGMTGGGDGNLSAGQVGVQVTFPPATSPTLTYQNNRLISLIGVP